MLKYIPKLIVSTGLLSCQDTSSPNKKVPGIQEAVIIGKVLFTEVSSNIASNTSEVVILQ